ncbi:hypothetical protein OUZ56_010051 [Daphnia magna]|uniref:Uncharacterized protein n=1 Tax=Daphnia magna TaxID=35525 RepID=A0ABR0AI22_9CRUS|nr:hypothetical protein OUZ56_010051 [Daphnia magna]
MLHDSYPHARINQRFSPTSPSPSPAKKEADLTSLMAEFPKSDGRPSCRFVLRDGAIPMKISGSCPISEPLKITFRKELNAQIEQGIIRKVPTNALVPWIHRFVLVPKK